MMGDDRAISCDSRFWGPIKGSNIIGKIVMLLWHDGHPDSTSSDRVTGRSGAWPTTNRRA